MKYKPSSILKFTIFFVLFFNLTIIPVFSQATNKNYTNSKKNKKSISTKLDKTIKPRKIVVTASRTEEDKQDIPLPASIIGEKDIEENIFSALVDTLDKTPGFTQIYEYHSPLLLRGMTSVRLIILKDGNRRMSSMPGGFMGQIINVYDVDRIEVIRGPGSVMYGSGATSGIINIISRDIFKDKGFKGKIGAAYGFNNKERMGLFLTGWNNGTLAMQLSGRYRCATNYFYGDGEEAENSFIEDKDISAKVGYKINDRNTFIVESDLHFGGPWGKPFGFNKKPMLANNENDNTYHVGANYTIKKIIIFEKIFLSGFYDYETRDYSKKILTVLGKVSDETVVNYKDKYGGGNIYGKIEIGQHDLIIGSDGYMFKIWSPQTAINYVYKSTNKSKGSQGEGVSSIGAFIQNNWGVSKYINLITGLRYDIAEVFEGDNPSVNKALIGETDSSKIRDAVSGNAGMVCHTSKKSSLTLNIGRAFRMPSSTEMFSEKVTCGGTVLGNPGLEPEYSWNIDLGFRGSSGCLEFDLSLFANFYHNLIERYPCTNISGVDQLYGNNEKARIIGGELVASYLMKNIIGKNQHLKPGLSFAHYRGDDLTDKENFWNYFHEAGPPLHKIPPARIKIFLRYLGYFQTVDYFIEIDADHSLPKKRVPEDELEFPWSNEDIDSYTLIGLAAGLKIYIMQGLESLKFNVKVNNLLDAEYYPFGSHILGKGRDIKIFVTMSF